MRGLLFLVVCLWCGVTQAMDIQVEEADVEDNRYRVNLSLILQARPDRVFAILTDYSNFYRLNDSFIESTLLASTDTTHSETRLVAESCVLVFCFQARFTYIIRESEKGIIVAVIDPERSDFSFGESRLELEGEGEDKSRIDFITTLKPSFWIPPFIGPWLLKPRMLEEVKETFDMVEKLANEG